MGMYRNPLLGESFEAPEYYESALFVLLPLTVDFAEIDFDAVMDNKDPDGNPLYPDHTLDQNLIDLGYHQKEHQKGSAFTYSILNHSKDECIGCVYIYPSDEQQYDGEVEMWIRNKYQDSQRLFYNDVRSWIRNEWPFKKVKITF